MRRLAQPGAIVALATLVAVAVAPLLASPYWVGLLTQGLIFALLAASLDVLLGYTGLPSLGHAAFYGIGGYGVGLAISKLAWDPWAAAGLGVLAAAVAGVAFGPIMLRGRGIYFLVLTLAFSQVLWGIAVKWDALTGGFDGIPEVIRPSLFGTEFEDPIPLYYLVAVVVVVSLAALYLFVRSPVGLALQGIRESESRMDQLGYRTSFYRWTAFSVSALFAGIAGALDVFYNLYVSPDTLFFTVSALVFLMVIVGSSGTLWGPAGAGFTLIIAENVISDYTERWVMVLGMLYIATAVAAPNGVLRLVRDKLDGRRKAGRPGPGPARPSKERALT